MLWEMMAAICVELTLAVNQAVGGLFSSQAVADQSVAGVRWMFGSQA